MPPVFFLRLFVSLKNQRAAEEFHLPIAPLLLTNGQFTNGQFTNLYLSTGADDTISLLSKQGAVSWKSFPPKAEGQFRSKSIADAAFRHYFPVTVAHNAAWQDFDIIRAMRTKPRTSDGLFTDRTRAGRWLHTHSITPAERKALGRCSSRQGMISAIRDCNLLQCCV